MQETPENNKPTISQVPIDIAEIGRRLNAALPDMAARWIVDNADMSLPESQSFAKAPDNPEEHSPQWHQYGIITHSVEFANDLSTVVPEHLERWGLRDSVRAALSVEIDAVAKEQLLQIVALAHDVGKFFTRKPVRGEMGQTFSFPHHEKYSGIVIRGDMRHSLTQWGLTDAQIEYVAACAELHFELGKVRRVAKKTLGYNLAFTESAEFTVAVQEIMAAHPDYALEVGLQFIADSSSKTTVAATGDTDAAIAAQRPVLEAEIAGKGLSPSLINQALQQPVNLTVARGYLRHWADRFAQDQDGR
ncbi:HD domain-containing protein [Nocardia altamirensis]|uniref:HD domain-containing protein n=1 Tax=Nocardia altamirensis TaxID=472158 RepID=UPI0008400A92|nr:HD domain-containing protein [Nocardia altamirensis]